MSAVLLILLATLLGVGVLWALALALARRRYARVGPESADLALGHELQARAARSSLSGAAVDGAALAALRAHLLVSYAVVVPHNRAITDRRLVWRARAVLGLLWSLLCVIAATIIMLMAVKLRPSIQGSL